MKIIAFVGMPGSGKSEASKAALEMEIPVISMGNIIRKEALNLNLDQCFCGKIANDLRINEGPNAIAKRCIPQIKKLIDDEKQKIIIIDGIRGISEVEYF